MTSESGPIEYATAADGVTIAYQRFGEGRPILRVPTLMIPLRAFPIEGLSRFDLSPSASTVTWDPRGVGLSDRDVEHVSPDTWIDDATAVAEAIGGPLPLYAGDLTTPVGLTLAARRPDLVSHLILSSPLIDPSEQFLHMGARALRALLDLDWDTCLNHMARTTLLLQEPEATQMVEMLQEELDPDMAAPYFDSVAEFNANDHIDSIDVPTLIIERRRLSAHREMAAGARVISRRISGARMATVSDETELAQAVLPFLGEDPDVAGHGAFRTIMFTDLVSSTALTQQVGDDAAQEVVEVHDQAVRDALDAHNGVQIKHTGDGIMAAFDSATDAARAARVLAKQLHNAGVGVRVGLNAGEPIERDGDLFGTAVQLAARLGDAAHEGQVLATQVVRDVTAGKGLNWSAAPAINAKGFDDAIPVFSLDLD